MDTKVCMICMYDRVHGSRYGQADRKVGMALRSRQKGNSWCVCTPSAFPTSRMLSRVRASVRRLKRSKGLPLRKGAEETKNILAKSSLCPCFVLFVDVQTNWLKMSKFAEAPHQPAAPSCACCVLTAQQGLTVPGIVVKMVMRMIRGTVTKTANFNVRDLCPIKHADRTFIPALFVAGLDDDFIKPHHRY